MIQILSSFLLMSLEVLILSNKIDTSSFQISAWRVFMLFSSSFFSFFSSICLLKNYLSYCFCSSFFFFFSASYFYFFKSCFFTYAIIFSSSSARFAFLYFPTVLANETISYFILLYLYLFSAYLCYSSFVWSSVY